MKKYTVLSFILAGFIVLGFYQNCSDARAVKAGFESLSKNDDDNGSLDADTYTYNVDTGDDVTLAAPEEDFKEFLLDGLCEWSYTDAAGDKTILNNPESTLFLPRIQSNQGGSYQLRCVARNNDRTFTFVVNIAGGGGSSTGGGSNTGSYTLFFIINGVSTQYENKDIATSAEALTTCQATANASDNTWKGVKCTYSGAILWERAEPKNTGTLYFGTGSNFQKVGTKTNVTRTAAMTECKAQSAKYPQYKVKCYWGTELIWTK